MCKSLTNSKSVVKLRLITKNPFEIMKQLMNELKGTVIGGQLLNGFEIILSMGTALINIVTS